MPSNYNTFYDNQFEGNNEDLTSPFIKYPTRIKRSLMEEPSREFGSEPIGEQFTPYGGFKSIDEGMSVEDLSDIGENRALSQSTIGLIGKALGQAVTEATLGTLEGAGYLLDIPGITDELAGNETEFDNFFSKVIRDAKTSIEEKYFPIYETHAAQNGAIFDKTSFANNFKNIASSVALMVPALGIARGINVLGKLAGMGAKTVALTEATAAGLASRHMENTMEAQQYLQQYTDKNKQDLAPKYQKMAEDEISKLPLVMPVNEYGFSPYSQEDRLNAEKQIVDKYSKQLDDESKKLAISGANKVYKADGALAVVDVLQYLPVFKGFGNVLKGVKYAKPIEITMQIGSEAFEEGFQQGNQMEAYESTKAGIDMFGPGYSERLSEYLKDKDMKLNAFWGAMGGAVFSAAAPIAKRAIDTYIDIDLTRQRAAFRGDVDVFNKIDDDVRANLIFKHAKRNRLEKLSSDMDALESSLDEQNWDEIGISKEEAQNKIKTFKEDIAYAIQQKSLIDSNPIFQENKQAGLKFLETKLNLRNNSKQLKSLNEGLNSLYQEVSNELDTPLLEIKKLQDNLNAFKEIKSNISSIPSFKKNKALKEATKAKLDVDIGLIESILNDAIKSYKQENPTVDIQSAIKTSQDQEIARKHLKAKELHVLNEDVVKTSLKAFEDYGKVKEINDKIVEDEKKASKETIKENINTATDVTDVEDTIDATPEEDLQDADNEIIKKANEEAIDASDKPDLRYQGKPNLFIKEMSDLTFHTLSEYGNVIDNETKAALSTLTLAENADQFNKNYKILYDQSLKYPNIARLFATVQKFYENIYKFKEDAIDNKIIDIDNEYEIDEYDDDHVADFHVSKYKTSDIGFTPKGEQLGKSTTITPNRTAIRQYSITKGENNRSVIKRVNGEPELNDVAKQMPIDWEYVNSPTSIAVGSEIYFVVNLDDTVGKNKTKYHAEKTGEAFINEAQVLIAQKDSNGVEHIISALPIYQETNTTEDGLKLKSLRNNIWNSVKASGNRTGMYNTGIVSKVTKKYSGMLLISNTKNNPHEVLKAGEKLILGIAKKINGVTTIDVGKNVDSEYSGLEVSDDNAGGVFMLIKGANGRIMPARCFTSTLYKKKNGKYLFQDLINESKRLLIESNRDNWAVNREQLRKIVYLDYNYIPKTDSFELRGKNGNVTTFTKNELDGILFDKIVQVSSSELNRGLQYDDSRNYNLTISKEGRLKTDLNPINNISNANFEFSLDYKVPERREINRIETSINKIFKSESLFNFSETQPGRKLKTGEFIPDNLGSQIFNAINRTIKGEVGIVDMNGANSLFRTLSKTIHPDVYQDESAKEVAEVFFKAILKAKNEGRVDLLNKLSDKFNEELHNINITKYTTSIIEVNKALSSDVARAIIGDEMTGELTVTPAPKVIENNNLPVEEPQIPDSFEDFDNPLGLDNDILSRLRVASNESFYQKWNELKETQWFKDRFDESLIDTNKFRDGLINVSMNGGYQAYGMFKNAVAYISGAAKTGTTYHEAFHVVFHLYLNDSQRAQILKDNTNLGKTDIEIEEAIADKFMEYVESEELNKGGLGKQILDFFKQLYYLVKSKITNDVTLDQVFFMAQHKMYKKSPFTRNVDSFKVTRYSIANMTPYEEHRRSVALSDEMRKALDAYIEQHPELANTPRKDVIAGMQHTTEKGAKFNGLDLLALKARAELVRVYNSGLLTPSQKQSMATMIKEFISMDSNGQVVFNQLARKSLLQFAKNEGLRIRLSSKEVFSSVDSTEIDPVNDLFEEDTQLEGWQISTENVSHKESLSNEVRKELSYIPQTNENGTPQVDDLGFVIYQDFNTVFGNLQRDLANSIDSIQMMEKMSQIVNNWPYLSELYNKLASDDLLRTKFFVAFQLSHVDYVTVRQRRKYIPSSKSYETQYHIFSSNRNGVKNLLIDAWKDNSLDPNFNKAINTDGSLNMSEIGKVKAQWDRLGSILKSKDSYGKPETKLMSNILNHIGITINENDLESLNKNFTSSDGRIIYGKTKVNSLKNDLDRLINRMAMGENPFAATSIESQAIENIAKTISKFRNELMESSFKNGENKTMYAHQTPTFLARSIQQFKGNNWKDRIAWYQDTAFYRTSPWLNELKERESRNEFGFIEIDSISYDNAQPGVRYTKMSPKDYENTAINMYFNNGDKNYVYYKFPVVSDAPKMPFIKFRRYSTNEVVDKLYDVYRQEWARISNIKEREEARKTFIEQGLPIPDELKVIQNYDGEKSKRFLLLSFLNTGHARKAVGSQNEQAIKTAIREWMETEANNDYERLVKLEVLGKEADGSSRYDSRINSLWGNDKAFHKDYFYNSVLANTQMMSIFSGDPAFYKADKSAPSIYSRTVDYQKRNKQNVSPKTVMDVNAVYSLTEDQSKKEGKNTLTVSPFYNTIYIKDLEIPSNNAEKIFETLVDNGMEESQAADIAGAYGYNSSNKINVTEAQAYITLPRYRDIMIGLGRWTTQLQDIYHKALDGKLSGEELLMVMQPIKPFYFGHSKVGNLVVPTQNKNSEYLLLPQLVKESPELSKLYDYMIKNNISSANFNSAVKNGEFGAESLDNIEKASVHTLNNADYGLQQETPEHHIDSSSLFGSQIRMLAVADIDENAEFELYGQPFNKKQLLDLYHKINEQDLEEAYNKVEDKFSNIENIHELLLGEILDRDMGEEREKAVSLVERLNKATQKLVKQFNLPLYHPYHAKSNESLMNSVFKNNVTKQKIKGGAFVQVSSFGFSDDLKLNIKDGRLVSAECKLPWWSKKYFEPLLDKDGQLDINKVPEDLREMIGYRIPTEDKYSMLPLKVTGFLPASAGGAVMLPMEITTISGSDFDIDKMYIMMPEWEVSQDKQDIRKIKYDLSNTSVQSKEARNNAKIDIIRAVLTHSDTFAKIFRPGGFPTLSGLADRVLKLEGKDDEMLPIVLPSTQAELFNRNMTGKALIGIFANHNKNHAVLQNTQVEFELATNFDNKFLKSLHEIKNANGDFISRNVAEWLAAVVDNAKNPLSAFINVNTYTADVAAMLTRLGYPLDTVVSFMSQPILKEFSNRYFNSGANKQAEVKVINDLRKLFSDTGIKLNSHIRLNTEEMFSAIKDQKLISEYQLTVLEKFITLKEQATALADLVRATRADTKGAGPTLSENDKLLRLINQVISDQRIIGQVDLFYGGVIGPLIDGRWGDLKLQAKIYTVLDEYFPIGANIMYKKKNIETGDIEAIEGNIEAYLGGKIFNGFGIAGEDYPIRIQDVLFVRGIPISELIKIDNPYLMVSSFTEYGIAKPTDILSKYFPWFKPAWKGVKDKIEGNLKGKQLSVKQIEQINYELLGYAASGFEFFDGSDKSDILRKVSKKLQEFKKNNPKEYEQNFFLNKLVTKTEDGFTTINFKNTGSLTEQDKQQVKKHWLYLLRDEKFSTFAKELIKYSYYSAGFQLTPNSFNHLIPVDFYSNLVDSNGVTFNEYLEKLMEESESASILNGFIDQFYKNNYDDSSFVPMVDTKNYSNITGQVVRVKGIPSSFKVNAGDKLTTNDFVVKSDIEETVFVPFVSMKENGNTYLFKLDSIEGKTGSYILTNKLGIPNKVLEYSRTGDNNSVFAFNNIKPTTVNTTIPSIAENKGKLAEAKPTEVKPASITEFTNYSGAAIGGDTAWANAGKKYNIGKQVDYTTATYDKLNEVQLEEVENAYQQAVRDLGRGILAKNTIPGKLVRRDYLQAKSGDAVFAISAIIDPKQKDKKGYVNRTNHQIVEGGTGYAVQMAINLGKPVYVFDQNKNSWFVWNGSEFESTETPILTKKFTGIGTREINSNGLRAIDDVFKKTVESLVEKPADQYAEITESIRSKVLNELKNDDTLAEYLGVTEASVQSMDIEQLGELLNKICNR